MPCWSRVHRDGGPERVKTRAAHFPMQHDEKTGMQRAAVGKSDCEAAS